jgi:hypothetical protein
LRSVDRIIDSDAKFENAIDRCKVCRRIERQKQEDAQRNDSNTASASIIHNFCLEGPANGFARPTPTDHPSSRPDVPKNIVISQTLRGNGVFAADGESLRACGVGRHQRQALCVPLLFASLVNPSLQLNQCGTDKQALFRAKMYAKKTAWIAEED